MKSFFCLAVIFLCLSKLWSQPVKTKWTNKDKGTVNITYRHIGVFPDESHTKIKNDVLIGISVTCYELTETGRKPLKKDIKINGRSYSTTDATVFDESDTSNNKPGFYSIWSAEGEYEVTILPDKEFYGVKSEKYFLRISSAYQFEIYLVRKNALTKK